MKKLTALLITVLFLIGCDKTTADEISNIEDAYSLLHEIFIETETSIEGEIITFPLGFIFEDMVEIDDVFCYSFRMSRLVDNHHWSYLDNVIVTPNRVILKSDRSIWYE